MEEILDLYFPNYNNGMMFMEETNDNFVYYKGIPGLSKEDLSIKQFIEKDFVSVGVKTKEETMFVEKLDFKIVKVKDIVDLDKDITVNTDKGVLTISIPKKYPVKEIEL